MDEKYLSHIEAAAKVSMDETQKVIENNKGQLQSFNGHASKMTVKYTKNENFGTNRTIQFMRVSEQWHDKGELSQSPPKNPQTREYHAADEKNPESPLKLVPTHDDTKKEINPASKASTDGFSLNPVEVGSAAQVVPHFPADRKLVIYTRIAQNRPSR